MKRNQRRSGRLSECSAQKFFAQVKAQAAGLVSGEHFTVDATLIEGWAETERFSPHEKGGSG
jgi:hypothetical protein